ncbi:MAG TPA: hypothetical protein VIY96_10555 [Thermoanaerobaculia bacterium]
MITILVVASDPVRAGVSADVEVLRARNGDEAAEKLGRNRRVDAVLLLCGEGNEAAVRAILEENPAPPPIYAPAPPVPPDRVRGIPAGETAELIQRVQRLVESAAAD